MADDFEKLPPHLQAQVADAGQTMADSGVQEAPEQSVADTGQQQDVSQMPDHAQAQTADAGQTMADQGVQSSGTVAPESGPPTDWSQQPGGDVPEPAQVDQAQTETQAPTQEQ